MKLVFAAAISHGVLPHEPEIRLTGLIVLGLVAGWLLWRSPRLAPGLIMGFGWYEYFTTNVGFVLDAAKLFGLICAGYIVVHPAILKTRGVRILQRTWFPYIIYCIVLTACMAPFWPEATGGASSAIYTTFRWAVQLTLLGLGFCIAIVIAGLVSSPTRIHQAIRTFMLSGFILAGVGLYQYVAVNTGLPINTIPRQGGVISTSARTTINGEKVFRPYSLAGEPKGFAVSLCLPIALLIFFGNRKEVLPLVGSLRIPAILIVAAAFYLTLSTAGFLVICAVIVTAFVALAHVRVGVSRAVYNTASLAAVVGVVFLYYKSDGIVNAVDAIYRNRVADRVQAASAFFTYGELGVFEFWSESPQAVLTGVGRGGSSFYIRRYRNEYAGYTASARGIIGELAEVGVAGNFLLYGPLIMLLYRTGVAIRRRPDSRHFVVAYLFCCCGVPMMLTKAAWIFPFSVIGLLAGLRAAVARPIAQTRESRPAGVRTASPQVRRRAA